MTDPDDRALDAAVAPAVDPALAELAAALDRVEGLAPSERRAVLAGTTEALVETVRRKVNRVLVLELNAARVGGRLHGRSPRERWDDFVATAARPEFWASLDEHYPVLRGRLATVVDHRCAAALTLARRFAADRHLLGPVLPDTAAGRPELTAVHVGAGDSHRGGHTVALLDTSAGTVVYKPRSVAVDAALAAFLDDVLGEWAPAPRIRVPRVVDRGEWGWAEHVAHRWCDGDAELARFYRHLGHWLAVARLLGGVDLHAENLIACGPVPVVVDCETLFTPHLPPPPTGHGEAVDRAAEMVGGSVLRTGLLPGRGLALGWRGIDMSAIGSLPGQQPAPEVPVVVGAGTDEARVELRRRPIPPAANHPSEDPQLRRWWGDLLAGFGELTERLVAMDGAGALAPLLDRFADCPVRVVLRATEIYGEVMRMLWHPVSLHDPEPAVAKAVDLLTRQGTASGWAPSEPTVVAAEVLELLDGDVPFFATTPARGRLDGPRGTRWGQPTDLVADAVARWRATDAGFEHQIIRAALVSAYLNEGWDQGRAPLAAPPLRMDDLDGRRRALAASLVRGLRDTALRGGDGTATWVAPVLGATGWQVLPLGAELYNGLPGVALLLAAYDVEVAAGRADPVDGAADLLADVLRTVRAAEEQVAVDRRRLEGGRPELPGGWIGLASQVWTWLELERLGWGGGDAVDRAVDLAEHLPAAVAADDFVDVLGGTAGAIVPLLALTKRTGDDRWTDMAASAGERLVDLADVDGSGACWRTSRWPEGIGGFAHGATGIVWALRRLALATGDDRFAAMAAAGLAWEESLWDPELGAWLDLRHRDFVAALWCHGAVGIGLAAADRLHTDEAAEDTMRRAAAVCWRAGFDWNHTLCHGDFGSWELLATALTLGLAPDGLDRATLDARVIGSVEEHGPISGLTRDTFAPGLLPGLGGVAYQLLRLHPDSTLPSVLVPAP